MCHRIVWLSACLPSYAIEDSCIDPSALPDLAEGLTYVRRTPHVVWLLFLGCLVIFAGVLLMMFPVYAREVLEVGAKGLGFLMGAYGAGGLIASASLAIMGNVKRQGGVGCWSLLSMA